MSGPSPVSAAPVFTDALFAEVLRHGNPSLDRVTTITRLVMRHPDRAPEMYAILRRQLVEAATECKRSSAVAQRADDEGGVVAATQQHLSHWRLQFLWYLLDSLLKHASHLYLPLLTPRLLEDVTQLMPYEQHQELRHLQQQLKRHARRNRGRAAEEVDEEGEEEEKRWWGEELILSWRSWLPQRLYQNIYQHVAAQHFFDADMDEEEEEEGDWDGEEEDIRDNGSHGDGSTAAKPTENGAAVDVDVDGDDEPTHATAARQRQSLKRRRHAGESSVGSYAAAADLQKLQEEWNVLYYTSDAILKEAEKEKFTSQLRQATSMAGPSPAPAPHETLASPSMGVTKEVKGDSDDDEEEEEEYVPDFVPGASPRALPKVDMLRQRTRRDPRRRQREEDM
eukprot:gene3875-2747_t